MKKEKLDILTYNPGQAQLTRSPLFSFFFSLFSFKNQLI
jgi:hypothetical protein